jgi:hypothetical protein
MDTNIIFQFTRQDIYKGERGEGRKPTPECRGEWDRVWMILFFCL